jgi:hypothetical protein
VTRWSIHYIPSAIQIAIKCALLNFYGSFTYWACPVFSDSEEGIISGLFGFKVGWGLVVKTGVESGAIVEGFDVMEDGATRFG